MICFCGYHRYADSEQDIVRKGACMQTKNEEKKKESLKRYAKLRGSWNGISPVSSIKKSGKIYDRKKNKTAGRRNQE